MQVVGLAPTHDGVAVRRRVDYLTVEFALYPRLTGRQHLDRFAHVRLSDLRYRDERFQRRTGPTGPRLVQAQPAADPSPRRFFYAGGDGHSPAPAWPRSTISTCAEQAQGWDTNPAPGTAEIARVTPGAPAIPAPPWVAGLGRRELSHRHDRW